MNKFAILLTCCVKPSNCSQKDFQIRKKMYLKVIRKWLQTPFEIYCVDSSGYKFEEISDLKFHLCSFVYKISDPNKGKTHGEIKSIIQACQVFKKEWIQYTHIIKITGRYYLEDLYTWTREQSSQEKIDFWFQSHHDIPLFFNQFVDLFLGYCINSEIFICKRSKLEGVFKQKKIDVIMERYLYTMMTSGNYTYKRLPPFKNTLKSRRGGDNLFLNYL